MAWRNSTRWLAHLEQQGELLRISEPVDVELEAGAIADRLVKTNGPAVIFEKPTIAKRRNQRHSFGDEFVWLP